jgi:hypothetical protein
MSCDFQLESQRVGLPSVWMYGGGRQSACIAALIIQGKLPRPDYAAIADTGREKSSTWNYLSKVVQPVLPFKINIVSKSEFSTVDLWGGKDGETLLIPAYTNETGQTGKLSTFCSNEWKVRVVERWLRKRDVFNHQSWIGFSHDEPRRWLKMKAAQGEYVRLPLVDDTPTTSEQTVEIVKEMGWPEPPHSSCWMCPNMRDVEWASLSPDEFEKACVLDEEVRLKDPHAFLHSSCLPLRQVKFIKTSEEPRPCESGVCFN